MRTVEKEMQESGTLLTIPLTHVPFRIIPGVEPADGGPRFSTSIPAPAMRKAGCVLTHATGLDYIPITLPVNLAATAQNLRRAYCVARGFNHLGLIKQLNNSHWSVISIAETAFQNAEVATVAR